MGGSARREAIHAGRWDRFKPKPVRLAISSFMVKDFEGNSHWYDLTKSGSILLAYVPDCEADSQQSYACAGGVLAEAILNIRKGFPPRTKIAVADVTERFRDRVADLMHVPLPLIYI